MSQKTPTWYSVSAYRKRPLVEFLLRALRRCGCSIVFEPPPDLAPYRVVFDTPEGERIGIMAYLFFANMKKTKNRPADEYRFQVKYGTKDGRMHELWQDPYGLYTTLFLGVDLDADVFVGADPVLHSPTRFFISIEFKREHVEAIKKDSWHVWERQRRSGGVDDPAEILVGGTADRFLEYVQFEREAYAEDQGHRQLLAEQIFSRARVILPSPSRQESGALPSHRRLHDLALEFQLESDEILDLISKARRLKMAVRGWVAEEHLVRYLHNIPGVSDCTRMDIEGKSDVTLRYQESRPIEIECKNVLRKPSAAGIPRLDFQRTRASMADPCSRYYRPTDFDLVAACLHAVTEKWEYRFNLTCELPQHAKCAGRLANNIKIDEQWSRPVEILLRRAVGLEG